MFRVTIVGASDLGDFNLFERKSIFFLRTKADGGIAINTTGDADVIKFANKWHIEHRIFRADWKKHGKDALMYRNQEMLDGCDGVIVFRTDIKDNDAIRKMAQNLNIPCRVVKVPQSSTLRK